MIERSVLSVRTFRSKPVFFLPQGECATLDHLLPSNNKQHELPQHQQQHTTTTRNMNISKQATATTTAPIPIALLERFIRSIYSS